MAITEYNFNGYEPHKKKNTLLKMQVPQHFDCIRNINHNKSTIRDQVLETYSEDLLIRSTKTSQREVIPYLLQNPKLM